MEQLTKVERERKYNRKQIKVLGTVPRGWSSDYIFPWFPSTSAAIPDLLWTRTSTFSCYEKL